MKILIVGGGVGGPALARFLSDTADVTLIDKAPAWGNIGYAITLWGNGREIIKKLGVESEVLKDSYEIPWSVFESEKGKILTSFFFDIFDPALPTVVISRAALQQALVKNLESKIKIKMNTTVKSMIQDSAGVDVTFSDSSTEKFDLVVGADGIHSQVRDMVFEEGVLKYYGWKIYAFWMPKKFEVPKGAFELSGPGKICFIYPMAEKAVVMFAVSDRNTKIDRSINIQTLLHKYFSEFKTSIEDFIDSAEDPEHIFIDNLAYVKMKVWYKGRVVLLGDAQHAISPITGMGSSMALEDAYVLAEEIKNNSGDIDKALLSYSKRRDGRIKRFHKVSNLVERFFLVRSSIVSWFRDVLLQLIPMSYFTNKTKSVLNEKI